MCVEDMSYIADARRRIMLVVQQLWDKDSDDDAFITHVEQVLSPDPNSAAQATSPIYALLGILVHLDYPDVLGRLANRILEVLQPLPLSIGDNEDRKRRGKGKGKAAEHLDPAAHFREELRVALNSSSLLIALQRRYCLASCCTVCTLPNPQGVLRTLSLALEETRWRRDILKCSLFTGSSNRIQETLYYMGTIRA
jgi:hypothetical protein